MNPIKFENKDYPSIHPDTLRAFNEVFEREQTKEEQTLDEMAFMILDADMKIRELKRLIDEAKSLLDYSE
ncbi:hypothetical protein [Ketogulonicigenium vulgare]|uniref:hypothetical protein n=1 Tax=Ketogulonicigenium vulgare TaxID=92945 RepID=UPI00235A19A5|nr:hypothetical protein [Ketogulonicigenium vulgare]